MKNYISFLVLIMLVYTSCTSQLEKEDLIGAYKSSPLNLTEKIKYNTNKDIEGFLLNLKTNGLFHYDTCGLLVDGYWEVVRDSLVLNAITIKFANDSINKIKKPKKRKDFLIFKIEGKSLIGFINETNGLRINKLKRVEK